MTENQTAAILIIGNEILSGRTLDTNTQTIALALADIGIDLIETRTIADNKKAIIENINYFRKAYNYVFTTGGIGPTHDDITSESIAEAFGVPYQQNSEIYQILYDYYKNRGLELNESRIKMSYIPKGSNLIYNKISKVPGFYIDNVFALAGIPTIMKAMLDDIIPKLKHGKIIKNKIIKVFATESNIAKIFADLQNNHPEVEMGSYPFVENDQYDHNGKFGTDLVLRSTNYAELNEAYTKLKQLLIEKNYLIVEDNIS